MTLKYCTICDIDFDARGRAITCSPECSNERERKYQRKYQRRYQRERYANDSEYREQINRQQRERYHERKTAVNRNQSGFYAT